MWNLLYQDMRSSRNWQTEGENQANEEKNIGQKDFSHSCRQHFEEIDEQIFIQKAI